MLTRIACFFYVAGVALLLACAFPVTGSAGEIADHAILGEQLINGGKPVEGLAQIETAFDAAWAKAPLGFTEALFVTGRPAGFGLYDPRASSAFHPGEPLMVYAEPYGYGFSAADDGRFKIEFSAGFSVRNSKGQVLEEKTSFADISTVSRRQNKEYQVSFSYSLDGLKQGDYVLATTLTDKATGKSATFELPFTITK